MKLNLHNAQLFLTVGSAAQLPGPIDLKRPQVAMCGRSNVGKSSLINRLLNRKSLARVSSEPGKTITVNLYDIDGQLYLADLPGYGYARRSMEDRKKWAHFIDKYLALDANILFLLLVDMKVGLTADDDAMLKYLVDGNFPFSIVLTKADKLGKTERAQCVERILAHPGIPADAAVIPFSSKTGEGAADLWEIIGEFYDSLNV